MPLQKIQLKPGVNRENTRYTSEGGWYECDKIRFRQGTPEKIGGWQRISSASFLGVCRSLWSWVTLGGAKLTGVGTNKKFYLSANELYYDITPYDPTKNFTVLNLTTTLGSNRVLVEAASTVTFPAGSYVTLTGAGVVNGVDLDGNFLCDEIVSTTTFYLVASPVATSSGTVASSATGQVEIAPGSEFVTPLSGWGASGWGSGTWGVGLPSNTSIRLWSQRNFGEDLVFGPRGGKIYYWDATGGPSVRAFELTGSDVPSVQNYLLVSDISRFVFAFGCNDYGSSIQDTMLIRWCDQEDATNWTPSPTNQAGSLRLSSGSEIITAIQSRQEVLVWTDAAVYSLQYVGAPIVWSAQLVGDNISIVGQNSVAYSNGVAYWMAKDKFYKYDGRVQPLRCDLRRHVFDNINFNQLDQVCCGTNEGFHEIWWFYPSANSNRNDLYVVYNYLEDTWYYGSLGRTAWLDIGTLDYPLAATYANNLVFHELGVDDATTGTPQPISAYITSAEFDLDDGHQFVFIWRVLPDITFRGSTVQNPSATMSLLPLKNSGSGYSVNPQTNANHSVALQSSANITRTAVLPVERFTGQIFTRVRGRQLAVKIESTALGVTWQLGSPRIDMRPDGRR
jgi:hypothetical protein